jgi:formylglycine-generating enzyme required for sulfatase activity
MTKMEPWRWFPGYYTKNSRCQGLLSNSRRLGKGQQPNAFGLYDMLGNAWQWCQDWWGENYCSSSPSQDPQGPSNSSYRVLPGGSWLLIATSVRSPSRSYNAPGNRRSDSGFRVFAIARTQ